MTVRMSQRSYEVPDAETVPAPSDTVRSRFSTVNTARHHCGPAPTFSNVSVQHGSDCWTAVALPWHRIPAVSASDELCSGNQPVTTAAQGVITNVRAAASGCRAPHLEMATLRSSGHTGGLIQKSQATRIGTISTRFQPIRNTQGSQRRPN